MEEKTAGEAEQAPRGMFGGPGCILCAAAMPFLERCFSENTRDHFRNSRVEFLKGIRGLIDDRIAYLSREERRGTKVTVE